MKNKIVRKSIKSAEYVSFIMTFLLMFSFSSIAQLKVEEGIMTIPTYKNDPPNPMPRFFAGKGHQGVQRRIYPYPYDDNLTNIKTDLNYHVITVENEFIQLGIMPQLGGRVYYAVDKTNNYNWFYHNRVVKPSLIGMAGNWISGSLAWGYPHHHGPTTVESMDYQIEEHADGSKTIWNANTENRHRLSILLGYTIYPNSSLIEMTIRPLNKTPISNSFLFWSNPAVHCDTTYQVIFPPSVQYVTGHGKREFTEWPVADSWFNRYDYSDIDISWWKNTHVPSSFFAWGQKENYFGGYDHGKNAGTAWVGNRHVSPGMKYWADGNNAAGRKINDGLTDNDGQYIELMAGFFTDNQPDYSWLQPYETKNGTMIWFPIRDLEGLKYANRNGAMNLEVTDEEIIKLRINTTSPHKQASVLLKADNGQTLLNKTISISPAEPFKADLPLPAGLSENNLIVTLTDADGKNLLYYKPIDNKPEKHLKPEPLQPFPSPEELKTNEELYLTGLRLNQFYNASNDPIPYYKEALKRDPNDYRVNTQLGILSIKNYDWIEAESYLRNAVERITSNYTRPKDGEGLYYLGVVLKSMGNLDEAYDYFYQASWTSAWHTASYYQLAEIDIIRNDYATALDHLNRSITTNTDNPRALNLKAIALRKLKDYPAAKELAESTLKSYVIDHQALNELYILNQAMDNSRAATENLEELTKVMNNNVQSYLELAIYYSNCGLYPEAADLLSRLEETGATYPMIYYYLGYFSEKMGDKNQALSYYQTAGKMPFIYCFPFRGEEIDILESAMKANPADASAPYYLGNLLYEHQQERAIEEWEKSGQLDNSFYIVHRNLGLAYKEVRKDYAKALASVEKAVALNKTDPRLLYEIDVLYDLNKVPIKNRYEFLKKNLAAVKKRSDLLLRFATRAVEYGKYDEAIHILTTNTIHELEGAREMQDTYLNAYVLRSLKFYEKGKYDNAMKDMIIAETFPIGLIGRARFAQIDFIKAMIHKKLGQTAIADTLLKNTIAINIERDGRDREYLYYQGMALKEVGRFEESKKLFQEMLNEALNKKDDEAFFDQFATGQSRETQVALNHYLAGLAYKGLEEKGKAKAEFSNVLKINPGHIWSKMYLDSMNNLKSR